MKKYKQLNGDIFRFHRDLEKVINKFNLITVVDSLLYEELIDQIDDNLRSNLYMGMALYDM